MALSISEKAYQKVNNSVLISGSARSGTTILGKLIHSLEDVEYSFEPPTLISLLAMIDQLPKEQWMLLCETCLYEDIFLSAISGRGLNCNRLDDSSIFNVKAVKDVELRLGRSLGKIEAESIGSQHKLAYKLPDIVPYIPKFQTYYPEIQVVIIKRSAVGTINSLMVKQWFTDDQLVNNSIWPFQLCDGVKVPFWVREDDCDMWINSRELDRAAYYYIRVNENNENIKGRIVIKYNLLLDYPDKTVRNLADQLGLKFGTMTDQLIAQVRPMGAVKDKTILDGISQDLREQVEYFSAKSN